MANGETASVSGSIKNKYYKDGLKLVLSAKKYINHIVSSLTNIAAEELADTRLPIFQIMSLTVLINRLNIFLY